MEYVLALRYKDFDRMLREYVTLIKHKVMTDFSLL
jgi:hypothetical protein